MNENYSGGCFSLRVPPVFCRNGNLIAIPKGRSNRVYLYKTLSGGETYIKLPESNNVITCLKSMFIKDIELLITVSYDGLLRVYIVDNVDEMNKPILEFNSGRIIIDMKITSKSIYLLSKEKKDIQDLSEVTLYSINKNELFDILYSENKDEEFGDNKNNLIKNIFKKIINFSYGGSTFYVSDDETLFCFIWKNILLIWTPKYSDRIIRFRHSEYILSLCLSENKKFIVTGDAYGRLTYWFLPPLDSEQGIKMWEEAPLIKEKLNAERMIYKYNINTSTLHWHSHELTTLCMIPETETVLSGGEEAVIVLWRQNFSHDSYNNEINDSNNGSRQFIPRLGAPIYTITAFKKNRIKINTLEKHENSENLPQLIAAVVCADNSIKILDLVHNRIINTIYGISTPFDIIKNFYMDCNNNRDYNLNLKIVNTKSLDIRRLLISVIGHPFKLHIHDLIKDNCYSSLLCKPEECYVSKVGDGISSSKLVQNDVTRITISNAYFSNDGKLALTVECQKFDHMNNKKRVYNLKFWRVVFNNNATNFELISKYPVAHVNEVISIEEVENHENSVCLMTITINREIKCWVYKEGIKEWINLSIINSIEDIYIYSTTFNRSFSKLFISSSNGIIVYNWNKRYSILSENNLIPLPEKDSKIIQTINLDFKYGQFVVGMSNSNRKLFVWDINTLDLIVKYDVDVNDNSKLIDAQCKQIFDSEELSFQFAIIKNEDKVKISLFNIINNDKKFSLNLIKELDIQIYKNTALMDSMIQYQIYDSNIHVYLVLLLSSCDVYTLMIDTIRRPDLMIEDEKFKLMDEHNIFSYKQESSNIDDIQESIRRMYLSIDDNIDLTKKLSDVSNVIKSIISTSSLDQTEEENIDSLSTIFCIKENSDKFPTNMQYTKNLTKNLNTFMCPSSSSLFWNLINNDYSTNSIDKNNFDIKVQNFDKNIESNRSNISNNKKENFNEILFGESIKPLQTQKLLSILKKSLFYKEKSVL